jgi:hypothetical protein
MLAKYGIDTVPQLNVMNYNIDLAAFPVAIEIDTQGISPLKSSKIQKRVRALREHGWISYYIWLRASCKFLPSESCIQECARFIKTARDVNDRSMIVVDRKGRVLSRA